MFQQTTASYHNVDQYTENEGFFYCQTLSRLDLKLQSWKSVGLEKLEDDLYALQSEYVDLDNVDIFIAILEFVEENMNNAPVDSTLYSLKENGLDNTGLHKHIIKMIDNIVECLKSNDYRSVDKGTAMRIQVLCDFMEHSQYLISFDVSNMKQLADKKVRQLK